MEAQFGMIGLGTMGCNFLLNVADSGFSCIGYDLDAEKRNALIAEGREWNVRAAASLEEFVSMLAQPRSVMLLVPAGKIVDAVIDDIVPLLSPGDLLIDGGNTHFSDTDRREAYLNECGFEFLGVGVSGGEEGARNGASIMVGGKQEIYERVRPIFEAASAKVGGEPCAAIVGTGSAGHFVKMVHNGIEYAMMQILAEAYDLMNRYLRMDHASMSDVFSEWNSGELESYLVEITSKVVRKKDSGQSRPLVEMILDTAGQKGTGVWTSQAALELGVAIPTIDSSVAMRQISAQKALRKAIGKMHNLGGYPRSDESTRKHLVDALRGAVYGSFIASYAQGLSLLSSASKERGYGLDLSNVAKIWRGGCIIRSRLLETIRTAYKDNSDLESLLLDASIASEIDKVLEDWRYAVSTFAESPVPGMAISSALFYVESMASERLPANLIQAQRDYFGAHTYKRVDTEGVFHTSDWDD